MSIYERHAPHIVHQTCVYHIGAVGQVSRCDWTTWHTCRNLIGHCTNGFERVPNQILPSGPIRNDIACNFRKRQHFELDSTEHYGHHCTCRSPTHQLQIIDSSSPSTSDRQSPSFPPSVTELLQTPPNTNQRLQQSNPVRTRRGGFRINTSRPSQIQSGRIL